MLILFFEEIKKNIKLIVFALLVGLIAVLPLIKDLTGSDISSRAAGVGLLADTGPLARVNEQRGEHKNNSPVLIKVFHNKYTNYGLAFLENWTEHYQGEFLFLSGDTIQRNRVPETGQMYLFDIVLLFFGFIFLIKTYYISAKTHFLILWWLLITPVAAALTFQSPHALRAQNMVIPLTIISALGLFRVLEFLNGLNKKSIRLFGYLFFGIFIFWSFVRYEHMYWVHMAKEYPYSSQYGVKELVEYVNSKKDEFEKVIVTDRYDQPYILFLFYSQYPPDKFQKEHTLTPRDLYGFSTVRKYDKFEFYTINWDNDQPANPNSLIAGTPEEIPDAANKIKEIYGTNEFKYFDIVAN